MTQITYDYHGGPRDGVREESPVAFMQHIIVLDDSSAGFYDCDFEEESSEGVYRSMTWNADGLDLLDLLDEIGGDS